MNNIIRMVLGVSLAVTLALTVLPTSSMAASPTGHEVAPDFMEFYSRYGGLKNFGYAVSPAVIEDGRLVQYFERQRFELHPEHRGTEYEVLLGRLGSETAKAEGRSFQASAPSGNGYYFNETQQSIEPRFQNYWASRGGLRIFGFPISAPFWEDGLLVQYFERARFEYHPSNAGTEFDVLLTRVGVRSWEQRAGTAELASINPADQVAQMINQERSNIGATQLNRNQSMITVGTDRSKDMANRQYFSHYTPENTTVFDIIKGYGISYLRAAETIHRNNAKTTDEAAQRAFDGFMNSSEHRRILMENKYSEFGVGYAKGNDGLHYFTVVVMTQ